MEQACAGCGYRSANRSFFRREKIGLFGRRKIFCHGCAPYRPTRLENLSTHGVWLFMAGALLAISGLEEPGRTIGYSLLLIGALNLSHVVTTIAHELGHAVAARLVGMKVVGVVVGSGPILAARQWQGIRFEIRRYLLAGGRTAAYTQTESFAKWRHVVFMLGGAGANVLLLALAMGMLALVATRLGFLNPLVFTAALCLVALLAISQILAIIMALLPYKRRDGHAMRTSDGRHVVDLLFAKDFPQRLREGYLFWQGIALLQSGRNAEAQAHFERAHRLLPTSGAIFGLLVHSTSKTSGSEAAVRCYHEHGGALGRESEAASAWARAEVAWHALLTRAPLLLPLADDLSERSMERLSTVPEIQATRGAILAERGQLEPGLALLTDGMRNSSRMADKARFAPFLARAERARGNSDLAAELEKLGQFLSAKSEPNALP